MERRGDGPKNKELEPRFVVSQPLPDSTWTTSLARWTSRLFSPPLLALAGVSVISIHLGTPTAWAGLYALLVIFAPVLYILRKVRVGEITDFHMRERGQRIGPMAVMTVCSTLNWGTMWVGNAPPALTIFAAGAAIQSALFLSITLRWKISGHGAGAAGLAVFLWALIGPAATPAVLAIPLVVWARVRRNRHIWPRPWRASRSAAGSCCSCSPTSPGIVRAST